MIGPLKARPDANGWFEPVLGRPPLVWPWALPHYFAVNVAPDPAVGNLGPLTSLRGVPGGIAEAPNPDRHRVEVIGFWHGNYRVVDVQHVPSRDKATEVATQNYKDLAIRFLLHSGAIVRENHKIDVTGDWPTEWTFRNISDLGVLCAYLYEESKRRGAGPMADAFRDSIGHAWPVTEQVVTFERCLTQAVTALYPWLSPKASEAIHGALWTIKDWRTKGVAPK